MGWLIRALLATTLLTGIFGAAKRLDPLKEGLAANYYATGDWTSRPVRSVIDAQPSTRQLAKAWNERPPEVFSATWRGVFPVLRDGVYTFLLRSDDGSRLYVDGELLIDISGSHAVLSKLITRHLARGVHSIYVDYTQQGGAFQLDLLWSRDGGRLTPMPSWTFGTGQVSVARFLASLALWRALAALEWIWVATLLAAATAVICWALHLVRRAIERDGAWRTLRWILIGSVVLNAAGLWWGLPGQWVPIETTPTFLFDALTRHFSHGWFDAYPPVHFYVLSAAVTPLLLLQALGRFDLYGPAGYTAIMLACRLVSVAAGAGLVGTAYLCGAETFGRRAGLLAAALFAMVPPFLYYAKFANMDVPYLFWWGASMVFYLRLLRGLRLRDFVLFAGSATLSIGTKDQAYGLYVLVPIVVIQQLWRFHRRAGAAHPLWRALIDRRLMAAAATAIVLCVVANNLIFNLSGFQEHVRFIVGPGSQNYRTFEPTQSGHLGLLRLTMRLIEESFGWPSFVAAIAGLGLALTTPRLRGVTLWLAVPAVSYYLTFINVVLYNYDRFVLPICFILALFGGLALDRLLGSTARRRSWRLVAAAAVMVYGLLYSTPVDILMIGDARYAVENWLTSRVGRTDLVASSFDPEYQPRLVRFQHADINTVDELRRRRPLFYVLNADYARAERPERPLGQLVIGLKSGSLGYGLVYRYRRASPWPWLPGGHPDLLGLRTETEVFSTLRNINPTIEVYQRKTPGE